MAIECGRANDGKIYRELHTHAAFRMTAEDPQWLLWTFAVYDPPVSRC